MEAIFVTVIPVFAIIALGYGVARKGLFPKDGEKGLHTFVFVYAIPALLFRTMTRIDVAQSAPWALWGAYFLAAAVVWVAAILASKRLASIAPAGGASAAIGASFGNLVMLGIPLSVSHFGEAAALPAGLLVSIHAPVHWLAATLRAEWSGRGAGKPFGDVLRELLTGLARNPIIVALLAGLAWNFTGLGLHPVVDRTIGLLGQAGVPAALFALGLSLAGYGFKGNVRGVTVILVLKMLAFPLIAWVLAYEVFALPPLDAAIVVLFAALPPGANAYLFAARYNAAVAPVSGAIAIGTLISIVTVSAVLWMSAI